MRLANPFSFAQWLEENRESLKPPVGNQVIWKNSEFIAMVVGGPNSRTDYHIDESEEIFYQIEGDIVLKVLEDGKGSIPRDIKIKKGELFLLPARVPHSPQRPPGTLGVVIERTRKGHEQDGFLWICEACSFPLYEEFVPIADIVKDMPLVFNRFFGSLEHRTCKKCKTVHPEKPSLRSTEAK